MRGKRRGERREEAGRERGGQGRADAEVMADAGRNRLPSQDRQTAPER